MPFYVPLGPRGYLFRLGTILIGVVGGLSYWLDRGNRDRQFARRLALVPVTVKAAAAEHP